MLRYLLVRARTGFNDVLCEVEKCRRYAEKTGRILLVDTTTSGLFDQLGRYLELAEPCDWVKMSVTPEDYPLLNTLPAFPPELSGRIDSYVSQWNPHTGRREDAATCIPLTFDFTTNYREQLLVHDQPWSGPLLSARLLACCRFTDQVASRVYRRLKSVIGQDYVAIHIRNTDYRTDYLPFLRTLGTRVQGRTVLVCSDDSSVFAAAEAVLSQSRVVRLSTVAAGEGKALHHKRHNCQYDINVEMLTDLVALASSAELFVGQVAQIGRPSGFGMLAVALKEAGGAVAQLS